MSVLVNNNKKLIGAIEAVMPMLRGGGVDYARWQSRISLDGEYIALHYDRMLSVRDFVLSQAVQFVAVRDEAGVSVSFEGIRAEGHTTPMRPGLRMCQEGLAHDPSGYIDLVEPGIYTGYTVRGVRETGEIAVRGLVEGTVEDIPSLTDNPDAASFMLNACNWALTHYQNDKFAEELDYMNDVQPYRF